MAYPMLNTERARIANAAVAIACFETGNMAAGRYDRLDDAGRWWALGDLYEERAYGPRSPLHYPARQR